MDTNAQVPRAFEGRSMKRARRHILVLAVVAAASSAQLSAAGNGPWSASIGFGVVDQDAIGGAPTVSAELERRLTPAFSLGLRGGYFTKEDCCGEQRDTFYGVVFARLRWLRARVQPFLETGGGRYEFEGHPQDGWFGGVGADFPLAAKRGLLLAARYHSVPRPPGGALPDFGEIQAAFHFDF